MPSASCFMLLYKVSALDRPLMANAIGQRILLPGVSPVRQFISFLICNKPAPKPTPDASVSRYMGFFSL